MTNFYFRNGPLRRHFDGLKYACKTVESVIFDLSLLPHTVAIIEEGRPLKRGRTEKCTVEESFASVEFVNVADLNDIKSRLDAYDAMRELVIKKCRDIQKSSKQAIFSLQGGKTEDARSKLVTARDVAKELLPIIVEQPSLRSGSYSNSLEEWAEGVLLLQWIEDRTVPSRHVMREYMGQDLTSAEYVGALSDLTGEVGRMAVVHAAKRQTQEVRLISQACSAIVLGMQSIDSNKFNQKFKAATTNLNKVELLLYELCMVERGGKIVVPENFTEHDKKEEDEEL